MQELEDIVSYMGLSDDITCFMLKDQPKKAVELEKRLHQFNSVNQFISQMFYYYRMDDYLYDSNTSVSMEMFFNKGISLGKSAREQVEDFLMHSEDGMIILPEQSVGGYLLGTASNAVLFMVQIPPENVSCMLFVVDETYYDNLLSVSDDSQKNCYVIYRNQIIAKRGALDVGEALLLKEITDNANGQKRIQVGEENYLVSAYKSDRGITYCTVQSTQILKDKLFNNQWKIFFVVITCVVIAGVVVSYLFKKIIINVRNFNLLINNQEKDYYNVGKIEEGIQMMIMARQEKSMDSKAYRKAAFVQNFINKVYTDEKEVLEAAKEAELRIDYPYYIVALLGRKRGIKDSSLTAILDMLALQNDTDGYGVKLINSNSVCFVLFGNTVEELNHLMNQMMEMESQCDEPGILAVSGLHSDYMEASQAYFEVNTALDNRFMVDQNQVLYFSQLPDALQVKRISANYIQQLGTAIRTNDKEEIEWIIDEICKKIKKENCSLLSFKLLYNEISNVLLTEVNEKNHQFTEMNKVFALAKCLTLQDFRDSLLEICRLLTDDSNDKATESNLMREIAFYMKEHYGEVDLNMAYLAEHFDISANVLSTDFKKQHGISPSDYLRNIRMKKAKKLLIETDMKLKDICTAVGYEEERVFVRCFKNDTGKTPKQYRMDAHLE